MCSGSDILGWSAISREKKSGSWRVYDRPGPYKPVTVTLTAGDAPVRAFVDMQPLRNFVPSIGRSALTAVVTRQGKDVLVTTLNYENSKAANRGSPQGPQVYRDSIGDIDPVEDGDYVFTIGPGDFDGLEVAEVDLVLRKAATGCRLASHACWHRADCDQSFWPCSPETQSQGSS